MATSPSHGCSWGYVILLSMFFVVSLDSGIAKSFGVLIPMMVKRLDSDYATVGLISSMPATLVYLFLPFVTLILLKFNKRSVAMAGGFMSGSSILACAFIKNTAAVGVCLALSGVGLSMSMLPLTIAINEFFPENFVFMNTITLYGFTVGSMLLPVITERAVEGYGYTGAFVILGGLSFNSVVCGATIRKAPRNVDTYALDGRPPEVDEEGERLIPAYQRNRDMSPQEKNSKDGDETENDIVEQRNLIQNNTQNDVPGDLPGETSQNTSPAASLLRTCAQSCGMLKETLILFSLPTHFLAAYATYAWMYFLVPHAEHLGIPESRAVFLSTIGGIGGVVGRTFFIILVGKGINPLFLYIIVAVICTTSFLLDFISSAYGVRAVLAFWQGFCFFIEDSMLTILSKTLVFDDSNFQMAYTISGFLVGLGSTCSGFFTGYLFDVTHSFTKIFIIVGCIHAVIVVNLIIITIFVNKQK